MSRNIEMLGIAFKCDKAHLMYTIYSIIMLYL